MAATLSIGAVTSQAINDKMAFIAGRISQLDSGGHLPSSALDGLSFFAAALSPVAVAANTSAEQLFPVAGLQAGSVVSVNKPSAQAGLGIVGARAAGANSLGITFGNFTAAPITPTANELYLLAALSSE